MVSIEEKDVTFTVTAIGPEHDPFTYQWIKEKGSLKCNVTDEQDTPTLTIQAAKTGDSGLYYCIVKNKWKSEKESSKAFLKVICKCCIQIHTIKLSLSSTHNY